MLLGLVVAGCSSQQGAYVYDWNIFWRSLTGNEPGIPNGIFLTVSISIVAQLIGVILGVFGALGRLARLRPIRWVANVYVWFFRGTPLLVQLMLFYYGLLVTRLYGWPDLVVGPVTIPGVIQAGIFALGVNEGAYMTEIIRAGIISVDPGQMEAAKSLGMTYARAMRRIVLPQAARIIVPPLGNEFNNMLKTTTLLVVLAVPELFVTFENLNGSGSTSFHPFELFLAAAVIYLVLTTIWGVIQGWIERRLERGAPGSDASSGPGLGQRLFGFRNQPSDVAAAQGGR
ncbi:MAG: amino acid ABC transporter permease [Candidatus Limnocylindrales bacterium]